MRKPFNNCIYYSNLQNSWVRSPFLPMSQTFYSRFSKNFDFELVFHSVQVQYLILFSEMNFVSHLTLTYKSFRHKKDEPCHYEHLWFLESNSWLILLDLLTCIAFFVEKTQFPFYESNKDLFFISGTNIKATSYRLQTKKAIIHCVYIKWHQPTAAQI